MGKMEKLKNFLKKFFGEPPASGILSRAAG
jgi:hypothetical protein